MVSSAIRLLLVDDHPTVLQGIVRSLEQDGDFFIAAVASTGAQALAAVGPAVDVAVVDLGLPDLPGLDLIARLLEAQPELGIVVLTMHDDEGYVLRAVEIGARAYVLKEQPAADLADAIRAVHAGDSYFSPRLTDYIVARLAHSGSAPVLPNLTGRENQVLRMIAVGRASRSIAEDLCLSVRTVQTYRERLMKKLDLHSIADLTRYAVAHGLVGAATTAEELPA